VGLDKFFIEYTLSNGKNKEEKLAAFVDNKDILITSPHCFKDVNKIVKDGKKIINFDYIPDKGSINMLNMALLDLKAV
jgi:GntR family transcriptional regulator